MRLTFNKRETKRQKISKIDLSSKTKNKRRIFFNYFDQIGFIDSLGFLIMHSAELVSKNIVS